MLVQAISSKLKISVIDSSKVPDEDLAKQGADKVTVRYLIDERHGSDNFSLRLYTVKKGGHTPLDEHMHEHHVYVLSGRGLLRESKEAGDVLRTLQPGDTVFIPSNAIHQLSNERNEPFVFLCVKGNPNLYSDESHGRPSDESEPNYC